MRHAQIERDLNANMATQIRDNVRVRVLRCCAPRVSATRAERSHSHSTVVATGVRVSRAPLGLQASCIQLAKHLDSMGDLAGSLRTW
jgi:hypothetical protein